MFKTTHVSTERKKGFLPTIEQQAALSLAQNKATRLWAETNGWGKKPATFVERTRFDRTFDKRRLKRV
jgi:hypothetical protein